MQDDLQGRTLAGRFRIAGTLERAHGVVTLLGTDLKRDSDVVVTAIRAGAATPAVIDRLEREVLALRGCTSPHLATLLHAGEADGVLFAVRPYIAGETLSERLRDGPVPVADAVALACDFMLGLQAMHDSGLLHRELEPASVILRNDADLRGVLVYAGLSGAARFSGDRELAIEAAYYVSPEEAGLLSRPVDERSDLYSAGAVLFECLCGRPPFEGETVTEVLRQHVAAARPSLRRLRPEVPEALEEVVQRMLRTEAEDRYPSATAVAFDLTRILAGFKRGAPPDIGADPRRSRQAELTAPGFVGRQNELDALSHGLAAARSGRSRLIAMHAESGAGKSRLLDELARRAEERSTWVLRAAGQEGASAGDHRVLDEIVATIGGRVRAEQAFRERLSARVRTHDELIRGAFPGLAAALGYTFSDEAGQAPRGGSSTVQAFTHLLAALGTAEKPALLLLDDCQWGDAGSLELLESWAEHTDAAHAAGRHIHLLLVAAFRSTAPAANFPLRSIAGATEMTLAPLEGGEVERLVESMADGLPAPVAELARRVSGGNPFTATEVVRGLLETGALAPGPEGWMVDRALMAEAQSSRRAARLVGRRLDELSGQVLELLCAGAVLGRQFVPEEARELARQSPAEAAAALEAARSRQIVWFDAESGHCAFLHDTLRDALLARLSASKQRELHLRVSLKLEASDAGRAAELAEHFDGAGEVARALPYALEAAAGLRVRRPQSAERFYRIAERGADPGDANVRRIVNEGLGELSMLRGAYAAAEEYLQVAMQVCETDEQRARVEGRRGSLALRRGDLDTAVPRLQAALRLLGERVPRRGSALVLGVLMQGFVQLLHSLFPRAFLRRRKLVRVERDALKAQLLSETASALSSRPGRLPPLWSQLRGMNLIERYSPTGALAQSYADHALAMTSVSYFKRAFAYGERSLAISAELNDVRAQANSEHVMGAVLYAAARPEEGLLRSRTAVWMLARSGDRWILGAAKAQLAFALYRVGRMQEAIDVSREAHAAAVHAGDVHASGLILGAWAKAAHGDIPAHLIHDELDRLTGDARAGAEVLQADALRALEAGEPGVAVRGLERARALVRSRPEDLAVVTAWLATALRLQLAGTTELAPARRRRIARRARRTARRARRLSSRYRNNRPHALREAGVLAAAQGRPRRARRWLDESLRVAEQQGAANEYALTLRARGEVGVALRWPEGHTELSRAHWLLDPGTTQSASRGGDEPTLSLADRFATLLDAGRSIASGLTRDAVFAAVYDAAIALLRAPRCTVFSVTPGHDGPGHDGPALTPVAGAPEHDDSRAAVAAALRIGTPVVTEADLAGAAHPEAPESVLCATVLVRGRPEACLYVSHHDVDGFFGEQEMQLAAYIATLAGAALENAQGFAAAQELSRSLEIRVEQRTAELSASQEEMAATMSLLSATLESTADGILVVDGRGMIVSYNRKFADMWRMPREVLAARDDAQIIACAMEQLVDAAAFEAKIRELDAEPGAESFDLLEFKDGRVFERYSLPQRIDGECVGRVWSYRDVTLQKHSERELEHLANHDGLTGLMNRRRFEHEVERTLSHISRYGGRAAAMILDVDNFKYVNDTLGHAAGDELIRGVASLLASRLRTSDVVARLGGDEFAVLLREVDDATAQQVAVDVLTAIRHHTAFIAGQRISLTASIGLALLEDGTTDAHQLIVDADLAMYEAKRTGRDGVSVYNPEQARAARVEARLSWAERLRAALENDSFELYAQPILDLARDEVSRHEILLRMPGEEGEALSPEAFLPSAERLGVGPAIDRWVVSHAIQEFASWTGAGRLHSLEINLSGTSIGDPELPALIAAEIEAAGIDPARLIFELTETAAIANMEDTKRFAVALRKIGCKFALDDFGTGFGSFHYLKHLPVDYLKIDGDSIGEPSSGDVDRLVIDAIVQMARGMGKQTVAEYVRDERTLEQVRLHGIDYAQGFHIGHPAPLSELTRAWAVPTAP